MPSFLEKIKSISQWEKNLATGYTREAQKLIRPNTIPAPISYLCLLYVYESEHFHTYGNEIKVNDQKNSVKVIALHYGRAYGVTNVLGAFKKVSLIYSWTFQIFHPTVAATVTDEQYLKCMKEFAEQHDGRLFSLRAMLHYFKCSYPTATRLMRRYAENNNITVKFPNFENPKNKCKTKTHTY